MFVSGYIVGAVVLGLIVLSPTESVGQLAADEVYLLALPPVGAAALLMALRVRGFGAQAAVGVGGFAASLLLTVGLLEGLFSFSDSDPLIRPVYVLPVALVYIAVLGGYRLLRRLRQDGLLGDDRPLRLHRGERRRLLWGRDYRVALCLIGAPMAVLGFSVAARMFSDAERFDPAELSIGVLALVMPAAIAGALTLLVRGRQMLLQVFVALVGYACALWAVDFVLVVSGMGSGFALLMMVYVLPIVTAVLFVGLVVAVAVSKAVDVVDPESADGAVSHRAAGATGTEDSPPCDQHSRGLLTGGFRTDPPAPDVAVMWRWSKVGG